MKWLAVVLIALCAGTVAACGPFAATHIRCTGKGVVTVTGMAGATLQADCGDGFEYHRESGK